jgi:hypothetical protein
MLPCAAIAAILLASLLYASVGPLPASTAIGRLAVSLPSPRPDSPHLTRSGDGRATGIVVL